MQGLTASCMQFTTTTYEFIVSLSFGQLTNAPLGTFWNPFGCGNAKHVSSKRIELIAKKDSQNSETSSTKCNSVDPAQIWSQKVQDRGKVKEENRIKQKEDDGR